MTEREILPPLAIVLHLGHLLRIAREERGWSVQDLADRAGVDKNTVSRLENKGSGQKEKIDSVAAALQVDLAVLRARVGAQDPNTGDVLLEDLAERIATKIRASERAKEAPNLGKRPVGRRAAGRK